MRKTSIWVSEYRRIGEKTKGVPLLKAAKAVSCRAAESAGIAKVAMFVIPG